MREIKFRAWNNSKGVMSMLDWYFVQQIPLQQFDAEHLKLMQFTGLLDKNHKWIFEGDIVEFYWKSLLNSRTEVRKRYSVVFKDGSFQQDGDGQVGMWQEWDELEVIGDIYQSPELLEATNESH